MCERIAAGALVALALGILATVSVGNGLYYDDEAWTLNLFARAHGPLAIIREANSGDVHPPLGYLVFAGLHALLGDWLKVKLAMGWANAMAVGALVGMAGKGTMAGASRPTLWLSALLAGGAASVIMWGASLRWYALFDPVWWLALGYVGWTARNLRQSAAAIAVAGLVLFHTNYLACLAVPPLALVAALRHGRTATRTEWRTALAILAAAMLPCLPQAWIMLHVHLGYQGEERGSLIKSAAQTLATVIPGGALVPLTPAALAFTLGAALALAFAYVRRAAIPPETRHLALILALGVVGMVLTGLGYRQRNSLWLHLPFLLLLARALASLPARLAAPLLALLLPAEAVSMVHVARHHGTVKRSFDTPYAEAMATIAKLAQGCPATLVFHHDPVLDVLLAQARIRQLSPYSALGMGPEPVAPGQCVIRVESWAGVIDPALIAAWDRQLQPAGFYPETRTAIGHDDEAALKSRLTGTRLPESYLVIERLRATRLAVLRFPAAPPPGN